VRVWVDLTNTAHIYVLRPLVERLEQAGHDVEITARPLSQTVQALEGWGHSHTVVGRHGGAGRAGKARAAAGRVSALVRFARGRRFDCALAHGSTDLPVVCRLFGIPNTTMFDYEWATIQLGLNCRLASRTLAPYAIPVERLERLGARGTRLVRYPGLKEEYYLYDFRPDRGVLGELGLDPSRLLCIVRTSPAYALYLGGRESALLPRVLERLADDERTQTVVLTRTPQQSEAIDALGLPRTVVPRKTVDARSLIAIADVVVSAGGTMNREAAVLGTPVWSIFDGRMGAVDELLMREGRLRMLASPDDLELTRKPGGDGRPLRRRDPADLLRLALPWIEPDLGSG
jgi:uncharacterized protein